MLKTGDGKAREGVEFWCTDVDEVVRTSLTTFPDYVDSGGRKEHSHIHTSSSQE
jgi:hypothetical protein